LDVADRMDRYQNIFSLMSGESMRNLFRDGLLPNNINSKILECWKDLIPLLENTDELGGLQFLEIRSSLPDELLLYADKISMRHGLELRVPFLDQDIVEYVERLPSHFKVRNLQRKWLHKRICKKFLPAEIIRRKKRGFAVKVVDDWFGRSLSGKFAKMLEDEHSFIYKYVMPQAVLHLLKDHQSGLQDNHKLLFNLIMLEEFFRNN
jgi:asparagine synthase (glutamine-hydrolysing)